MLTTAAVSPKGSNVTLYIDGKAVGNGRVEQTAPMVFSADETSDVGLKRGSPMIPDMPSGKSAFNGTVQVVVIETGGETTTTTCSIVNRCST